MGLDQRWRRAAIRAAGLRAGQRVLDLGAGTGDLALMTAERVAPTGIVAAFDLSHPMLRLAQQKADRVPPGYHVRTINGRAEQLPVPDAAMDAVVSAFVMRNVSDLPRTLAECRRVLAPGGRLVVATPNPRSRCHRRFGVSWMGLDPPRHLHLFPPGTLRREAERAGFRAEEVRTTLRDAEGM